VEKEKSRNLYGKYSKSNKTRKDVPSIEIFCNPVNPSPKKLTKPNEPSFWIALEKI